MKLSKLIVLCVLASAGSSFGASGIFGSYINVTSSNHGNIPIWYDAQAPGGGRASDPTDFSGFAFGSFNPGAGGVLNLTGGEVLTFKNGGSDVTGTTLNYRIYTAGFPTGSHNPVNIGFTADATFADAAGTSYTGTGDQKWSDSSLWNPVNLLSGLTPGDYEIDIYLEAASTDGTLFSNNGGSNYKATFTVVPEPSAALLGGLGALALLRRRRI
ncbi:MAG: hypothetical protein Q8Q59_06205 [Luteolibacter sp.]|jgi:hypothetical protein|nr:hypothetical protein [Luteolibacter sp.]